MALVWLLGSAAGAAPDAARLESAKRHFDLARAQFTLGNYAAALHEFDAAYALDPRPLLLYNAGLAARSAGALDVAQDRLRRFVHDGPHGRERDDALVYLDELKERAAHHEAATPPPAAAEPATAAPSGPAEPATVAPAGPATPAPAAGTPSAAATTSAAASPSAPTSHPTAAPLLPPAAAPHVAAVANSKPAPTPLYRRWWLWSAVGLAAAGLGVGLGVGLAPRPWSPNLPPVKLHAGALTLRF